VPNFSEGAGSGESRGAGAGDEQRAGRVRAGPRDGTAGPQPLRDYAGGRNRRRWAKAAILGAGKALELIDMNVHKGRAPREWGATDVVPFIPVEGVTLEDCVAPGEARWGRRSGSGTGFQFSFYEAAATRPERVESGECAARGSSKDCAKS